VASAVVDGHRLLSKPHSPAPNARGGRIKATGLGFCLGRDAAPSPSQNPPAFGVFRGCGIERSLRDPRCLHQRPGRASSGGPRRRVPGLARPSATETKASRLQVSAAGSGASRRPTPLHRPTVVSGFGLSHTSASNAMSSCSCYPLLSSSPVQQLAQFLGFKYSQKSVALTRTPDRSRKRP
jgi:hypothetical protein